MYLVQLSFACLLTDTNKIYEYFDSLEEIKSKDVKPTHQGLAYLEKLLEKVAYKDSF